MYSQIKGSKGYYRWKKVSTVSPSLFRDYITANQNEIEKGHQRGI